MHVGAAQLLLSGVSPHPDWQSRFIVDNRLGSLHDRRAGLIPTGDSDAAENDNGAFGANWM